MKTLRVLIFAPGSNPDSISTSLVGYSHSEALAKRHQVTLVVSKSSEAALRKREGAFHSIIYVDISLAERCLSWMLRRIFKGNYGSQVLTALSYPYCLWFDWCAWRLLKPKIQSGEFDVALRILPVASVLPSFMAFALRRGPIPFVVGPVNGGLPWPVGFKQAEKQKEWISALRTYRDAKAIIAGSSQTYAEFSRYSDKLFFIPENGLTESLLASASQKRGGTGPLNLVYVGRLVPYKACDIAIRASAPLLLKKQATLTIIGDGPERDGLRQLATELGVSGQILFSGWLSHGDTMQQLQQADVLVFPSLREFGGGVVFEALALGVVPVVVDYGGPGDIVNEQVGYKVALTNEQDMTSRIEAILIGLANDRSRLNALQQEAMRYANQRLSWDGKAALVTDILLWAAGHGPKPTLPPAKMIAECRLFHHNQPASASTNG
jgi:glycosyltransferase involved in cell wall biosynthesis